MKRIVLLLSVCLVGFPLLASAAPTVVANTEVPDEHVVWIKKPIEFVVPVGQQRLLSFPKRVELVNSNPALTSDKVSVLNNNGTLYLTAKKPFAPLLVSVRLVDSGEVVLVSLSGSQNAKDLTPLDVVLPSGPSVYQASPQQPNVTVDLVSLMRFAVQQFGVARVATHPAGIVRTPMFTHQAVPLVAGGQIESFPLVSWRGGDLTVTAVELKNLSRHTLTLKTSQLVGDWQAASFYRFDQMRDLLHPRVPFQVVTPVGTKRDFTLVFVISTQPFGQALTAQRPFVKERADA